MSCDHEFINSNRCAKCGVSIGTLRERLAKHENDAGAPSYTDDVVAVMRDTITAQRQAITAQTRTIEAQSQLITELRTSLGEGAQTMALARAIIDADRAMRAEKKEAAT